MTELETLQRAKMYMDKLANGINPIDDTIIPEDEVVNNVRLSRCFFYVSGVLQKVIDEENAPKKKASVKKIPYAITQEQKAMVVISDQPVGISEITGRLNAHIDPEVSKKLQYGALTKWLLEIGMLEMALTADGTQKKRPTQQGMQIGIAVEDRIGSKGSYQAVVYNRTAQQFIVDNLEGVLGDLATPSKGTPAVEKSDARKTCDRCALRVNGSCGQLSNNVCDDYRPVQHIPKEEFDNFPKYGDATAYKMRDHRHFRD